MAAKVADRVEGWRRFGRQAGRALSAVPDPRRTFLLTFDRKLAAELAFYVPGHPRTYVWHYPGAIPNSQYDLWPGPPTGRDALIICPEGARPAIAAASGYFEKIEPLAGFVGGEEHRRYHLYLGHSLKQWPK
jgi:hypothetical protein